jgi:hypothetical protein
MNTNIDTNIDIYIELYKTYFNSNDKELNNIITDFTLLDFLSKCNWDEALNYCFKNDLINSFKLIYLFTSAKFQINHIVEMENILAEKCGKVYKPKWNSTCTGFDLELLSLNISDEFREKYQLKMNMISFIVNCRVYSRHIYINNKFYYYFLKDKYTDRIQDILRESC